MPKGATHINKQELRKQKYFSTDVKIPNENEGEVIGEVIGTLGCARFSIKILEDSKEVQASAQRSFKSGPRKEYIKIKDYVIVQPGISKNQYFINHLYSQADIEKLYDRRIIGKPKTSTVVENEDVEDNTDKQEPVEELTVDDIWNAI